MSKMKSFLVTFNDPKAVSVFVDTMMGIPNGAGIVLHIGAEVDKFSEEYRVKFPPAMKSVPLPPILQKILKSA